MNTPSTLTRAAEHAYQIEVLTESLAAPRWHFPADPELHAIQVAWIQGAIAAHREGLEECLARMAGMERRFLEAAE